MKILVTGGAGFVGTNLISLLKKSNGNKIYSIDNYSIGSKDNHMTGVEYIDDDIQNANKLHDSGFKVFLRKNLGIYTQETLSRKLNDGIKIINGNIIEVTYNAD